MTAYRFRLRGDVAADWTADNPVMLKNEIGFEEDTGRAKLGDGAAAWSALPYLDELWPGGGSEGGDHPDVDHATLTTVIAGLASEITDRQTADSDHAADQTTHGVDFSTLATDAEVAAAVATHAATPHAGDHPDGDHAGLATSASVTSAVSSHEGAANPHPTYETSAEAQAKVDAHINDATAAHAATAVAFTPSGSIAASTVQAAIEEVAAEATGGGSVAWTDVGNLGATETVNVGNKEATADQACTITVAISDDEEANLIVHQDATGGRALTFSGVTTWVTASPITTFRAASAVDRFKFERIDGVTYGYWISQPATGIIAGQDEGPTLTEASLGLATSMLDAAFTIPAGLFRAGDVLEVAASGSIVQNSGSSRVLTFSITLGTTTITITSNQAASASTVAFSLVARCRVEGIADQNWSMALNISTNSKVDIATTAENLAVAKTLDLKVNSAATTATQTIQLTQASVRRIAA